jgi:uncharacterized protein YecT (DUF1311 family)
MGKLKMKKILLLLSCILAITLSLAQTREDGRAYFENSDKQLNDVYQNLLVTNQSDTVFTKNLKTSQRAWLQFRDAQFSLLFPEHASIEKRDLLSNNELIYLAYLTENRTKVLRDLLNVSTIKSEYISDLQLVRSNNIYGGIGLDKPYWTSEIIICGKKYKKGVVIHPEDGGNVAYAEFLIPRTGGQLLGVAGYCEGNGSTKSSRKMRFRIFVDNELLYGNELIGKECLGVNLNLGKGKVLRIETDDGGDRNYFDHMAFGDLRIIY